MNVDTTIDYDAFALFLCLQNSKKPATPNGYKDAVFNFDVDKAITEGYNVGMANSISKKITLDCDYDTEKGLNGIETLMKLEKDLGPLPKTLTQRTPRNGRHYIFSSKGITSPIGKIGKDIDVKYNGYILIAPSSINGKSYEIINNVDKNGKGIIAELPENWLNFINRPVARIKNTDKAFTPRTFYGIDIDRVFVHCSFLRFCRDHAEVLEEPIWHAMISILSAYEVGEMLIHSLSEPYPNYSFDETQRKINYAKKFGRPMSCKYISETYPEICGNCTSASNNRKEI